MRTEAAAKRGMVNGVDVDQLYATIEAVKDTPDIAKFQFRITNKWISGGHNHITVKEFYGTGQDHLHEVPFELEADEHQVLLGDDTGPNPVEYLLAGLSGCLTSALIYHAAAKGISIKGVQSTVEGDLDLRGFLGLWEDIPAGYKEIRVHFKIDADVSEEQKRELIEIAQKYSPVFNSVAKPTPVSVTLDR